jgi:hypothetical protein
MTVSVKVLIPILALILSNFATLVQGKGLAPVSGDDAQNGVSTCTICLWKCPSDTKTYSTA